MCQNITGQLSVNNVKHAIARESNCLLLPRTGYACGMNYLLVFALHVIPVIVRLLMFQDREQKLLRRCSMKRHCEY